MSLPIGYLNDSLMAFKWLTLLSFLIHVADPQSLPVVIVISHMSSVRPSVPTFQNLAKRNNFQVRLVIATGRDCGSGRVDP